jgi:hypothetical protein
MADTDLAKQAKRVVDSLYALAHRRGGLIKVRKQVLKNRDYLNAYSQDESSRSATAQDAHEGRAPQGFFSRLFDRSNKSKSRGAKDYVPKTDFHEAQARLHQPGTGNTNPEHHKF